MKASRAEREARLAEIAKELEQLDLVRRQARALLPQPSCKRHRHRRRQSRAAAARCTQRLAAATRRVLLLAIDAHRHEPDTARWLHDQLCRLDEPLRVAIAGKVKAGKSTLLNALVGEQVAPTDAGECTRVVTWYRDGTRRGSCCTRATGAAAAAARAPARRRADDRPRRRPRRAVRAAGGRLAGAEPAGHDADRHAGDRLDVGGGLAAHRRLPRPRRRHAHRGRRRRLPACGTCTRATPRSSRRSATAGWPGRRAVNAVAVLSRADEIGGGRVDAMFSARSIAGALPVRPDGARAVPERRRGGRAARRDRPDPAAGRAHRARRAGPRGRATSWRRELLSVDRFLRAGRDADVTHRGAPAAAGAVRPVRHPPVDLADPAGRRRPGRAREGAGGPQRAARARAGAAHAVHRASRRAQGPVGAAGGGRRAAHRRRRRPAAAALAREIDRILSGAHEFTELRLLGALRSGTVTLPTRDADDGERLLGDAGASAAGPARPRARRAGPRS